MAITDRLQSLLSAIDALRCDFTCRMTEKSRSAVAEATGNVSTRAKHAITSGNAVGVSNSFCYLTFKQFPSQTIDMIVAKLGHLVYLVRHNYLDKIWGPGQDLGGW